MYVNRYNSCYSKFLNKISKHGEFFDWAEQALLTGLFPVADFNNRPVPSSQRYIYDGQGYLAGTVRLRQLRVKPGLTFAVFNFNLLELTPI